MVGSEEALLILQCVCLKRRCLSGVDGDNGEVEREEREREKMNFDDSDE